MRNDDYKDFDLELRSMLQDAGEEVPSGLWDGIASELDRRDRRKVVALRWRRAATAVAAAAAVLAGIFVIMPHGNQPEVNVVAQQIEAQPSIQDIDGEDIPTIEEQIEASSAVLLAQAPAEPQVARASDRAQTEAVAPSTFDEPVIDNGPEAPVTEEVTEPAPEAQPKQAEVRKPVQEHWDDPFAKLGDEKEDFHVKGQSLYLSGNTIGNDISSPTRQLGAPVSSTHATTGIQEKSLSTYGVPLTLGLGARFDLTDKWSIGTGIDWSLLSRSFTGIYTEVGSEGVVTKSINAEIQNDLHYIGIPLNVYYNIFTNRNLKFYVWGGGEAEKGLVNSFRIQNGTGDIRYKESVSGLQWSTALGLGLEFTLNDFLGLYIDPSARYYFDCNQPNSVRTAKPYMLNFEVGLRFDL